MKVSLIIGFSAVTILLVFLLMHIRYDRLVKQIWRSLKSQPTKIIFTQDMVADLAEPVQRYFLHAIAPGTALATYVELEMSGGLKKLKPDANWLPMQASQIISTSPGFVWQANIGKGLTRFNGADYYSQGKGRMKFSLGGLIPLVDAQNKDIDRSGSGRLAAEYIWLPSALLLQNGVAWQAISDNTIQANFKIDNEPIALTLNIDGYGKLLNLSLSRWGDETDDKSWQYLPFGGEVQAEKTFDGYTIPVTMTAGWWFGTDRYSAFFRSTIESARFR